MITLFLLACQTEFLQVDTRHVTKQFVEERYKNRTIEDLWVEQCVAKKGAGP